MAGRAQPGRFPVGAACTRQCLSAPQRLSLRSRRGRTMMERIPASILCDERCHLGEGPTYDAATDTAWWFDILEGRLFEAQLGSGQVRIHHLGRMASALARIDAGQQLIVAEDGLYIRSVSDGSMSLYA